MSRIAFMRGCSSLTFAPFLPSGVEDGWYVEFTGIRTLHFPIDTPTAFPVFSAITVNQLDSPRMDANREDLEMGDTLDYMREVARVHGINSLTEAIVEALKWRRVQASAEGIIAYSRERERYYASQPESKHADKMKDFQVGKVAGILELLKAAGSTRA